MIPTTNIATTALWRDISAQAARESAREPLLQEYLQGAVLDHHDLGSALTNRLSGELVCDLLSEALICEILRGIDTDSAFISAAAADICATFERDSACKMSLSVFLFYKGFIALQAYRVAHRLWLGERRSLALLLQSQISLRFGIDIHPAAKIGCGIMLDHASGLVIGETAVIEDAVSIMQSVTLGGTGKESGDRHPKIGHGVLIGPGAKILGNISIGCGAMVAASSVVLKPVAKHAIVAGVPARVVGDTQSDEPAMAMNHYFNCQ